MEIPQTVKESVIQSFNYLLILFLLFLLIEEIWPNTLKRYINPDYFMIAVIAIGIPAVLWHEDKPKPKEEITKKDYLLIALLSIAGFAILYYKLKSFPLGIFISIIGGILIFLLSYLVLTEDEQD
ncbi:MAG: hypothetical protein KQA35_04510 [Candidatus Aenigmarchaeota archaeon]|nr:hypothetical protein [Candidatus Aenigmarchaeota archaeon]